MKRVCLFLAFLFCVGVHSIAQNMVYYYELEKTVTNGNQRSASGDGHYLAINSNGLYECDANGSSFGYGFVQYKNSNNGHPLFEGKAYLGRELSYVFNADYSRLNLYLGNGTIHVYTRRSSPSSESAKRIYRKEEVPVMAVYPEPASTVTPNRPARPPRECQVCKGSGREPRWSMVGATGSVAGKKKWCDICKKDEYYGHYHVYCETCRGKGYIE